MKRTLPGQEKKPQANPEKRRGLALVSVMLMLTLATILAVTYLALAKGALNSSALYSDGISAQQIAEGSVNLVINQIRQATKDPDKLWMSQPGMVRNYDSQGDFSAGYKLYSDDEMVVEDEELRLTVEDPIDLKKWTSEPARWVDLNAPVIRGEQVYYPIADPAAANRYQELDPDYKGVEGFSYSLDSFEDKGPLVDQLKLRKRDPLPMPVRWLYQLKDGTLGSLDSYLKFKPMLPNGQEASKENPIVARMAFWTDDESCKVNVNTASEPTFWDTPRAAGREMKYGAKIQQTGDRRYGWSQPAQREYQRFPGHPATTAMSPILLPGLYRMADPWIAKGPQAYDARKYLQMKEFVYRMAPRIQPGGSIDATRPHELAKPVKLDRDRLYPNIDEYLFQAPGYQWTPHRGITYHKTTKRAVNVYPKHGEKNIIPKILPHAKFFLTANSRAPEVNLFGMPRVSMWPTHVEKGDEERPFRSVFDDLIRFCSATGKPVNGGAGGEEGRNFYFFQREDSESPTRDWTEIKRNQEVFDYLEELTSRPVPGYGGSFAAKLEEDHEQVLTSIFDYIRSTNLYDDFLEPDWYEEEEWLNGDEVQYTAGRRPGGNNNGGGGNGGGYDTGMWGLENGGGQGARHPRRSYPGHGQVAPIEIEEKETRGMGRFFTVSEVGILMICNADAGGPDPKDSSKAEHEPNGLLGSNDPGKNKALPRKLEWAEEKQERSVQAMLLLELFTPSQGWTQIREDISIGIEIEKEFSLDGEPLEFPLNEDVWQSTGDLGGGSIGEAQHTNMWGGTVGFWGLAKGRLAPERDEIPADEGIEGNEENRTAQRRKVYPFISVPVIVNGNDETVDFGGGRLRIEIRQGNAYSRDPITQFDKRPLIQVLTVEFPDNGVMPLAKLATTNKIGSRGADWIPDDDPTVDSNGDGDPKNDGYWEYSVDRPMSGDPPKMGKSNAGILFASYWWSLTKDGCKVGDLKNPTHGGGNWLDWSVANPEDTHQNMVKGKHRGRLQCFGHRGGGISGPAAPRWCFHPADVVRTMVPRHGDYRLLASKKEVPAEDFVPHRFYFDEDRRFAHHFTGSNTNVLGGKNPEDVGDGLDGTALPLVSEVERARNSKGKKTGYNPGKKPDFPQTEEAIQITGDFDNGVSITVDGAYINKPDEGNGHQWNILDKNGKATKNWTVPYYHEAGAQAVPGPAHFSPNRQVPSPVMFGSLPTGVKRNRPWQTLLFRPQMDHPGNGVPASGPSRGSEHPPDHLLLDLFWMPVVEPYAISEPFSTAGKINLNYQMLPFTHIERSTGLRAVMTSEEMLIVPMKWAAHYKNQTIPANQNAKGLRRVIDMDETLKQFEERFNNGGVFRTASEICDVHLVPDGIVLEDMEEGFWKEHALTGDNSRERPYANIYPRVTAQSNTFRVHYIAQVLRKPPNSDPEKFDPKYDTAAAEYRGSTLIERYLEPHDPNLPDYAAEISGSDNLPGLDEFYKFRIISSARFAP